jgi:hypothetical protein
MYGFYFLNSSEDNLNVCHVSYNKLAYNLQIRVFTKKAPALVAGATAIPLTVLSHIITLYKPLKYSSYTILPFFQTE